jgi:uncharacterized membrane protein
MFTEKYASYFEVFFFFSETVLLHTQEVPLRTVRELIAALGVMCSIWVATEFYSRLPERIATHFNAAGVAYGFGARSTIWVLVGVAVWSYGMLSIINFLPGTVNLGRRLSPEQERMVWQTLLAMVGWLKAEMAWLVAYLVFAMARNGLGRQTGIGKAFSPVLLVVIVGTCGFYLAKIFRLMRETPIAD